MTNMIYILILLCLSICCALKSSTKLTIDIYTTAKQYIVGDDESARLKYTIQTWLQLPQVKSIIFLGYGLGLSEFAKSLTGTNGIIVECDENIDTNFLNRPLFNSLIYRSVVGTADVGIFVNSDILLYPDLVDGLNIVSSKYKYWMAFAARWDINDETGYLNQARSNADIRSWVTTSGRLHSYGGVDLWAFNRGAALVDTIIPSFVFGRGKYDNWFTHETIHSNTSNRVSIDLTEAVTMIHREHNRSINAEYGKGMVAESKQANLGKKNNFWSVMKKKSWEQFINLYYSSHVGSYKSQMGTALHSRYKMTRCVGDGELYELCIQHRIRPGVCNCEYSSFSAQTDSDPEVFNDRYVCGKISIDKPWQYEIEPTLQPSQMKLGITGVPHVSSSLIEVLAINKTVIMTAATYAYRDIVMSFACNLKKLGITNFVVAALDKSLYKYLYVRGLPVYYADIAKTLTEKEKHLRKAIENGECSFGSTCFRTLTKLKSRSLLLVLKMGYNVIWSDTDIVWFKNPVPYLLDLTKQYSNSSGLLLAQSNEPDAKVAMNDIRRINSGFYLAISSETTIKYFEMIVEHAMITKLSEQPSFYEVLCGIKGEYRLLDNQCLRDNMRAYCSTRGSSLTAQCIIFGTPPSSRGTIHSSIFFTTIGLKGSTIRSIAR